uniref:Uncharacterized protein n=1 Tax=Oryzias latipes TaxID=8090 RepID=A0A3P9M5C6_ORYLA
MSHKSSEWNSGLLSCCDDMSSCCYGFWCFPCLACTVAGSFGENRCLPLCDICSPAAFSSFGIPLCVPPAGLSLRVGIRHMYGIKVKWKIGVHFYLNINAMFSYNKLPTQKLCSCCKILELIDCFFRRVPSVETLPLLVSVFGAIGVRCTGS